MAELIIAAFAVYGVTTILTEADGPFGLLYKIRKIKWLSGLECFICSSVYLAVLPALLLADGPGQWVLYTFGLSGVAILAHKFAGEY